MVCSCGSIYYDNGQQSIAEAVHKAMDYALAKDAVVYRSASPADYRLSQVADYICTMELTALKYADKSATEAAFVIEHCDYATLDEKAAAWKEVIGTMPDCPMARHADLEDRGSVHGFRSAEAMRGLSDCHHGVDASPRGPGPLRRWPRRRACAFCRPNGGPSYSAPLWCAACGFWQSHENDPRRGSMAMIIDRHRRL